MAGGKYQRGISGGKKGEDAWIVVFITQVAFVIKIIPRIQKSANISEMKKTARTQRKTSRRNIWKKGK